MNGIPAAAGGERGAAGGVPRRAAPEHEDDADAAEEDEDGAQHDVDHEYVPLGRPGDTLHSLFTQPPTSQLFRLYQPLSHLEVLPRFTFEMQGTSYSKQYTPLRTLAALVHRHF